MDCNDADATVHPNADEVCDGIDNDCDGAVDELPSDGALWYTDADGDGFGDGATGSLACAVTGAVSVAGDCDDTSADVRPGADEVCDGIDNDCDGTIDEATSTDAAVWYADVDGDGYGDEGTAIAGCAPPSETGFVSAGGDCNDDDVTVFPGAADLCDGIDNDCDGLIDGGVRVPADFADLQSAVDAAPDGAIICVDPGEYTGHTYIDGRTLTILGTGGSAVTFLHGDGTGNPLAELHGSDVSFQGLTFTFGYAPFGSGILVDRGTVAIDDVAIINGSASGATGTRIGGALDMDGATVTATNLNISGNYGGIGANEDGDATGVGFAITSGSFTWTGGYLDGNVLEDTNSDVPSGHYSRALSGAPGGYVGAATVALTDVAIDGNVGTYTLVDNEALNGGLPVGVLVTELGANVTLTGVDFTGNSLTGYGSGAEIEQATLMGYGAGNLVLDDVSFVDNIVDGSSSPTGTYSVGALMVYGPTLTSDGLTMTGNTASVYTGVAATTVFYGGTTVLSHLDVRENSDTSTGVSDVATVDSVGSDIAVSNFVIADNSLSAPGWIAFGPIFTYGGSWTQGDITGNDTYAFGAYSGVFTLAGATTITNVNIIDNTVSDTGYGYYCWGGNIVMALGDVNLGTFDHDNVYGNTGTRWNLDRVDSSCNTASLGATSSLAADPVYVDTSGATGTTWDLHLGTGSPDIDAGDPSVYDSDASVSDIGAYGGPAGSTW